MDRDVITVESNPVYKEAKEEKRLGRSLLPQKTAPRILVSA
jgi:hypothetical protein